MSNKLVVTRHQSLYQYLVDEGYIEEDTPHISHADETDIIGKHVYGILPNWLACKADKITEIQLRLPVEKRSKELTVKEIKWYAVKPKTYIIIEVDENEQYARLLKRS